MELIPHPMALPGCCFKCRTGSENRDWFIDFNFSIDDFGAVIICNECIRQMAQVAGYFTPDQAAAMTEENRLLRIEIAAITIRAEGLEQAVDGLRLAGSSVRTYSESDVVLHSVEDHSEPSNEPGKREDSVESGEEISAGSVHDEGMAIVPDDASSGQFRFDI